ncbi:MAG: serine/threonine protein kinase [Sandaracinus sp.]|nr:serine/threonine protein kinase [Myxococcales bacterium]MCB9600175.1 serine/threonine protein kinase [Sandaracinus sp.]
MLPAAATFGPYELLERIGMGGMAEVFLARQRGEEGFERLIAIKRILPQVAEDDSFVRMFVDEAKIAVQLSHPNIAQIYDLGREGDTYFIAQEYVHGRDMGAVVERQQAAAPLPIPFVLYVASKVCEALAHAHEAMGAGGRPLNLIHRDVSPSNVLVSFEGGVKVIDFGLAKAAGRLVTTQAGVVKGKLAYLSSEQARGLEIDSRSDLFSLGVCMFEWLSGQRLFQRRNDIETVVAVQKAEVPPLRALRPDAPPVLQQIVMHALAPDPDRRFQSAQEMHDALLSFIYDMRWTMKRKAVGEYVRALFPEAVLDEPVPMDDDVPRDTRPARPVEAPEPLMRFHQGESFGEFEDETFALDDSIALLESEAPIPVDADDLVEELDDLEPLESAVESIDSEPPYGTSPFDPASVPPPADDAVHLVTTASGARAATMEPFEDTTSPAQRRPPNEPLARFEDTTFPERDELPFDDATAPFGGPKLDSLLAQAVATSPVIRTPESRLEERDDGLDVDTAAAGQAYPPETSPGAVPFDLDFDDVTRVGDDFEDESTPSGEGR